MDIEAVFQQVKAERDQAATRCSTLQNQINDETEKYRELDATVRVLARTMPSIEKVTTPSAESDPLSAPKRRRGRPATNGHTVPKREKAEWPHEIPNIVRVKGTAGASVEDIKAELDARGYGAVKPNILGRVLSAHRRANRLDFDETDGRFFTPA